MAHAERGANRFTVNELREILREKGLTITGAKHELIARLFEEDPAGSWMLRVTNEEEQDGVRETIETRGTKESGEVDESSIHDTEVEYLRRSMELCEREKRLMERELRLMRQENDLLRRTQNVNTDGGELRNEVAAGSPTISHEAGVTNINAIASLLGYFEGDSSAFESWKKRVESLRGAYNLTDDLTRILIGARLKGKAQEWLHSSPTYTEITVDELLNELKNMFFHEPGRVHVRKQFEQRIWRREETFNEYLHQKVILGNRIKIEESEMVEYVIEGIPDPVLRDQARVQRLRTRRSLIEAFERVSLRGKEQSGARRNERERRVQGRAEREESGATRNAMRCHNCGAQGHRAANCPSKAKGTQNFKTKGRFDTEVEIDDERFLTSLSVVPNELLQYDLLIGTDLLDRINLYVEEGKITMRKPRAEIRAAEKLPEIFKIELQSESSDTDLSHLTSENENKVSDMINKYNPTRKCETEYKMTIILRDDEPVYQRPRRLSPSEKEKVTAHINEWLDKGIIQPSLSEYASPVVLVKKGTGETRLCVDYRQLNKKIIKDRYPLPLIDDQLDALQGASIFSTIDLKNGFFHVPMEKESRKYTSFVVPDGQYEFLYAPFGLCNSPAVFQRFINQTFRELIRGGVVLTYVDDLIIPSTDFEAALSGLEKVLGVAERFGLNINWKKCKFLQTRVEFWV
ncbi:uncharacterized protein LOC114934371 [Nylanderia fulva]|uniref:uncharacterized protein LOC114934371 n=1 Tax=Nylanderia fulva TaxID=613905 RepID=UPI0010FB9CF2|nr:uncharacterized protein LOC114934371 [Nylanderia fulva]